MEVAGRRVWILVPGPPPDRRAVFLLNYWPVVAAVLARYDPAAIVGLNAVKLHLGEFSPPETLRVYHAANDSVYTLVLEPGFVTRLRPYRGGTLCVDPIAAPGGVELPVLAPAALLATLDEPEIADGIEPVSAWLRHLVIRTPDLTTAVTENPRPQVLQRLADMAGELGNTPLARQLDQAARRISPKIMSPARTGVGTRLVIPEAITAQAPGAGSPWRDEQAMRLARQEREVAAIIRRYERPKIARSRLIASALAAKAYDAYHSTTLEGYRISPEAVDALVRGERLSDGPEDEATLRAAMAVQGYARAFDRVLTLAQQRTPITRTVILDLYETLFRPSVDAGFVEPHELRRWRNRAVGLQGWRWVPPNEVKVPDLMLGLEEFTARTDVDPVARALLVHLEFVTVHPFIDGNGRLGRLLMNYELIANGLPWVTVRADERMPFFQSIERAQVEGDTGAFIRYLWHLLRRAIADVESGKRRGRRGRR